MSYYSPVPIIETVPPADYLYFYGDVVSVSATSASIQVGEYFINTFNFGYGYSITSAFSCSVSSLSQGTNTLFLYSRIFNSSDVLLSAANSNALQIKVNYVPKVSFTGTPNASQPLTFQDTRGSSYLTGTVVSADWDFGDGNTSSTTDLTATFEHTYSSVGIYTVSISAYDVSGNVGVGSDGVAIFESNLCESKEDYITICGPEMLARYGNCREINLTEFIPLYLQGGETEDFTVLFEEFLNNMFDGLCGWQTSADELLITKDWSVSSVSSVSAEANRDFTYDISGTSYPTEAESVEQIELHWPTNAGYDTSAQKISILEKVARLTELHDPDLIDIDYIQFFASNLGYNVNVSRDEIGNSGTNDNFGTTEFAGECSAVDINRYLRFVVRSLPSWYKIKTTNNSIKVMLYSFGLIAELKEYFTDSYLPSSEGGKWRTDDAGDLSQINNNWFPTPHFLIRVNFDESSDVSFDIQRRQKVIRAIESIRPVNAVFKGLEGYVVRQMDLQVGVYMRATRYTVIESNGYSNGWG